MAKKDVEDKVVEKSASIVSEKSTVSADISDDSKVDKKEVKVSIEKPVKEVKEVKEAKAEPKSTVSSFVSGDFVNGKVSISELMRAASHAVCDNKILEVKMGYKRFDAPGSSIFNPIIRGK